MKYFIYRTLKEQIVYDQKPLISNLAFLVLT